MARRPTTEDDYRQRLLNAQRLVEQRLDEAIEPSDLARAAHFSLHHFHRIFRAQMGETVMQHVRRLRLERAARKLRSTDTRLLELALEAGYESHEAFTRAFIDRFGQSPSQFRALTSARLSAWQSRAERARGPVTVRRCPALHVAFMRHRGGYAGVSATWGKMLKWALAEGLVGDAGTLYGVCPDDPDVTEEPMLRFDACAVVPPGFVAKGEVGIVDIAEGTYAIGIHRGPYETLHETYLDVIGRWFPTSGREPAADAVVEHYLNDPSRTEPSELLTEVRVRIAE